MTKDKRDAVIWLLSMFKADELGELEPLPTWYQGIDKDMAEAVELAISALYQPQIPDNATNGDVIESIFQHTEYNKYVKKVVCATTVMKDWWNAPYKGVKV